jgi:hypothetical protein
LPSGYRSGFKTERLDTPARRPARSKLPRGQLDETDASGYDPSVIGGGAMERRYWVTFVVIALVIGLIVGFGIAFKASQIPELEKQIQQLTKENADLKAKLASPAAPAASVPSGLPAPAVPPTKP